MLPLRLAASGYAEVEIAVGSGPGCSEVGRVFELEDSRLEGSTGGLALARGGKNG